MTLTVTINLNDEVEQALRESVESGDKDRMKELLANAVAPTVEALLNQHTVEQINDWQTFSSDLSTLFTSLLPANAPILSDYAMSREAFYEENV